VASERRRMHAVTVVRQPAQDGRSSCVTARTSRAHTNQQTIPEAQCLCTYHGHLPRELTPGTSRQQREFDGSWHPLAGSEAARLASIEALEMNLVRSRPKLVACQSFSTSTSSSLFTPRPSDLCAHIAPSSLSANARFYSASTWRRFFAMVTHILLISNISCTTLNSAHPHGGNGSTRHSNRVRPLSPRRYRRCEETSYASKPTSGTCWPIRRRCRTFVKN
jgi:hypothetical protein